MSNAERAIGMGRTNLSMSLGDGGGREAETRGEKDRPFWPKLFSEMTVEDMDEDGVDQFFCESKIVEWLMRGEAISRLTKCICSNICVCWEP